MASSDSAGPGTTYSDTLSILSAMSLIARRAGLEISPDDLASRTNASSRTLSEDDVTRCARELGLRCRHRRLTWRDLLRKAKLLPAIVGLKGGGSMVLSGIEGHGRSSRVIVQDSSVTPAPELRLGEEQFGRIWSGRIILLSRSIDTFDEAQPFSSRLIVALILREWRTVRDIAISAAALSFLALTPVMFWQVLNSRVLAYRANGTLVVACLCMALIVAAETAFGSLRRYLLVRITSRIDLQLTTTMFARVLDLPVEYFERTPTGFTLHNMGQIVKIRNFLTGQLFGSVLDCGVLFFFIPVMLMISPGLTAIVLSIGAMIFAWIIGLLPAYRRRTGLVVAAEAACGTFLSQTIYGIRTVKSLALDSKQRRTWDLLNVDVSRARIAEGNLSNLIQSVVTPLERIMVSGSYAVGVYVATTSRDPVFIGTLFAFLILSQRVAAPLMQMAQLIHQYDEARAAVAVVGQLINQPPEEGRTGRGIRKPIGGEVTFSDIRFTYKGATRPALKSVSFNIPQGSTLGVMGRSGSGKTTITRLLQRFSPEYTGMISIDGIDIRDYDLTHFRSSLGVVMQESFLFSGTIRENITIAKVDASYENMVHAARLAGAEEFIDKLPRGYETYVEEGSSNLSGGQKQRLAIARALITDPKILIFDEATSALDAESEAIVNANIDRIAAGRTVISISHRLSSLVKADAILVMEQGEVNDIGTHEDLLERNDIYASLWYTQNQHISAPPEPARPRLALTAFKPDGRR